MTSPLLRGEPSITHLLVLDFEATCDAEGGLRPQEIIEFPSVLLDADLRLVDVFESFVRPVRRPRLTDFCTELTSITQADVDGADPFPAVLSRYLAWLDGHGLPTTGRLPYVVATCGNWDLRQMLPSQLTTSEHSHLPAPFRRWINVKVPFRGAMPGTPGSGLMAMLSALGLPHEGRHHRGIDDCHNLVAVLRELRRRGVALEVTNELPGAAHPPLRLLIEREGVKRSVVLRRRRVQSLLGVASEVHGRAANRAFIDGRPVRRDEDLFDLASDTIVRVF